MPRRDLFAAAVVVLSATAALGVLFLGSPLLAFLFDP